MSDGRARLVCSYGDELRQFHAIGNPPQEDTTSEAYSLGQSPSPPAALAVPKYGSGSSLQPVKGSPGSRIPATLGGGGDEMPRQDGVLAFGGAGDAMNTRARYVSQVWDRGTLCDKTGMPRSVEVQVCCFLLVSWPIFFCWRLTASVARTVSLQYSVGRPDSPRTRDGDLHLRRPRPYSKAMQRAHLPRRLRHVGGSIAFDRM